MTNTDLRDLLDHAVEPLDTMPDAVPEILRKGHRSVRLRRGFAAGATIAGAACGVVAIVAVSGLAGGAPVQPPAASAGTSAGTSAGVSVTSPAVSPRSNRSPKPPRTVPFDPAGLEAFMRSLVPTLDAALPDRFGRVTHAGENGFRVRIGRANVPLTIGVEDFSRAPVDRLSSCRKIAGAPETERLASCADRTMPDGSFARATTEMTGPDGRSQPVPTVDAVYRDRILSISLFPVGSGPASISNEEMLDVLADPGVQAAFHTWVAHPEWIY